MKTMGRDILLGLFWASCWCPLAVMVWFHLGPSAGGGGGYAVSAWSGRLPGLPLHAPHRRGDDQDAADPGR